MEVFALVDCNNFYVSCERVFKPEIRNKPALVLSNNDGCCVARSNEVKKLGIPMGAPFFKIKDLVKKHQIQVFSSNYELYADMSSRVMEVLFTFSNQIEVYSIDEAFLNLKDLEELRGGDYTGFGKMIRERVKDWVGVPVSVGIAPTKTLAKVAGELAKKNPEYGGSFSLMGISEKELDLILKRFEVGDVWGIGRQYSKKLAQENILTAYDFKYANPLYIKKTLNINGLKTQNELKGVSCLPLEEVKNKKGICTSRSFGKKVTSLNSLQEAVSSFVTTASEKLRDQDSKCYEISVFIRTNFFSKQDLQYSNIASYKFLEPTSYSPDLIKASRKLLKSIYRPGYLYQKAGVYLSGIVNGDEIQESLFSLENFDFTKERKQSLMDCVDKLNKRFGNQKVTFASNNLGSRLSVKDPNSILNANKEWKTKSSSRSDRYTTNWEELLKINLK